MNSAIVWVLTFTVLGVNAEHKTFAKYKDKQECEQALIQFKEEYKEKKQKISGTCTPILKQCPYDGGDQVSTGQLVTEWTARDRDS